MTVTTPVASRTTGCYPLAVLDSDASEHRTSTASHVHSVSRPYSASDTLSILLQPGMSPSLEAVLSNWLGATMSYTRRPGQDFLMSYFSVSTRQQAVPTAKALAELRTAVSAIDDVTGVGWEGDHRHLVVWVVADVPRDEVSLPVYDIEFDLIARYPAINWDIFLIAADDPDMTDVWEGQHPPRFQASARGS